MGFGDVKVSTVSSNASVNHNSKNISLSDVGMHQINNNQVVTNNSVVMKNQNTSTSDIEEIDLTSDDNVLNVDEVTNISNTIYGTGSVGIIDFLVPIVGVVNTISDINDISNLKEKYGIDEIIKDENITMVKIGNMTYTFDNSTKKLKSIYYDSICISYILANNGINYNNVTNVSVGDNINVKVGDLEYQFSKDNYSIEKLTIGEDVFFYDENGNIYKHEGSMNLSIFNKANLESEQYGASQMDFTENSLKLLKDENINSILSKYFPNESDENYTLLFSKLCNVGCGYAAITNAIFTSFEGREQEFLETFGFSMYSIDSNGNVDYNYEPLMLEIYCNYWKSKDYNSIDDMLNKKVEINAGLGTLEICGADAASVWILSDIYDSIKVRYGLDLKNSSSTVDDSRGSGYLNPEEYSKILLNEPDAVGVIYDATDNWTLYSIDPVTGEKGEIVFDTTGAEKGTSGHAMYVTGFTENGDIIVSSWGKEFILKLTEIGSYYYVY